MEIGGGIALGGGSSGPSIGQITGDVTAGPASTPAQSEAATLVGTANVNSVVGNLAAVSVQVTRRSATATAAIGETTVFTGSTTGQTITLPVLGALTDAVYRIVNDSSVTVNILGGTNSISINGTIYPAATPYPLAPNQTLDFVFDSTGVWQCMAIARNALSPATTVIGPDAYGAPAVVGTSLLYARQDHDHGLPAAPSPALSYDSNNLSADVSLANSSMTAFLSTASLAIGTWLVTASFLVELGAASNAGIISLEAGSATVTFSGPTTNTFVAAGAGERVNIVITAIATITVAGTLTFYQSGNTAGGGTIRHQTPAVFTGNSAGYTAVKIS